MLLSGPLPLRVDTPLLVAAGTNSIRSNVYSCPTPKPDKCICLQTLENGRNRMGAHHNEVAALCNAPRAPEDSTPDCDKHGFFCSPCKALQTGNQHNAPFPLCPHNRAAPPATPSYAHFSCNFSIGAPKKLGSIILVMMFYVVSNRDGCLHLYILPEAAHGHMFAVRMSAVLSP